MGHAEILEIKFVAINILRRKRLMLRVNSRVADFRISTLEGNPEKIPPNATQELQETKV